MKEEPIEEKYHKVFPGDSGGSWNVSVLQVTTKGSGYCRRCRVSAKHGQLVVWPTFQVMLEQVLMAEIQVAVEWEKVQLELEAGLMLKESNQ